jgi:hypothetical protein
MLLPKSASVLDTGALASTGAAHLLPNGGAQLQTDEEFEVWRVRNYHAMHSPRVCSSPFCSPWCYSLLLLQVKHPCILQHFDTFLERVNGKRVAVFLDYDGTFPNAAAGSPSCAMALPVTHPHLVPLLCLQVPSLPSSTTLIRLL